MRTDVIPNTQKKNKGEYAKREVKIMTINIQNKATINAQGVHTQSNHKPIYCITTGTVYASATDAAEAIGVKVSTLSHALTRKSRSCRGMKFCFVSQMAEHLEEITAMIREDKEKARAYDEMVARKEAVRKAKEELEIHRANCERLREELERETKLVAELEELIERGNGND